MDKSSLKNTLRMQSATFKERFERKLSALISGKNCFTNLETYKITATANMSVEDAFLSTMSPNNKTTLSANKNNAARPELSSEKQKILDRIAALRGCSLPGDYLNKN